MGYYDLKSAILDKHWYLMGGEGLNSLQEKAVHYSSLDSLIASSQPSETSQPSLWKELTNAPYLASSPAVLGNRLISIGGGEELSATSTVYAYSTIAISWIHVGDMPFKASNTCSIVLPTGELMMMGGFGTIRNVLKATIKGNDYLRLRNHYYINFLHYVQ